MTESLLKENYDLKPPFKIQKSEVGAGSDTYFISCEQGKYVLKFPCTSEINHAENEPALCEYLLAKGVPACRFIKNKSGEYIGKDESGRIFHLQQFIEGKVFDLNCAPDWLLEQSARMLGRIHLALRDYPNLPEGIGKGFFEFMTPENAMLSYKKSLETAKKEGRADIASDIEYRIALMERFPKMSFDLSKLTCRATHGDFFISQLICGESNIKAVIDWTTACVHPVVWEIVRSFVYASPKCAGGEIDTAQFLAYVSAYRSEFELSEYDLRNMLDLFFYQIAVCDYYGQYFSSDAANRSIYLHQAVFSTKLMRRLEKNRSALTEQLLRQ